MKFKDCIIYISWEHFQKLSTPTHIALLYTIRISGEYRELIMDFFKPLVTIRLETTYSNTRDFEIKYWETVDSVIRREFPEVFL